jgi:hypothetical protein
MSTADQQFAQHPVACLTDTQLGLTLARVLLSWRPGVVLAPQCLLPASG